MLPYRGPDNDITSAISKRRKHVPQRFVSQNPTRAEQDEEKRARCSSLLPSSRMIIVLADFVHRFTFDSGKFFWEKKFFFFIEN